MSGVPSQHSTRAVQVLGASDTNGGDALARRDGDVCAERRRARGPCRSFATDLESRPPVAPRLPSSLVLLGVHWARIRRSLRVRWRERRGWSGAPHLSDAPSWET